MRERRYHGMAAALLGWGEVTVRGLMPEAFLNECAALGVTPLRVEKVDALTLVLDCPLWQRELLERSAERSGCETEWGRKYGLGAWWRRRRHRRWLMAGAAGVVLGLFVSSLFVWEIEVAENPTGVPDGEILAALEDAGVGIGSFWPGLSIDMLRSRALRTLPELSYLTVNIHGSRAEVLVRGAEARPEIFDASAKRDVVARKSGVITSLRVLEGETLCREGETVTEGQVLISARRGIALGGERLVHARGEITARTWYEKTAAVPLRCEKVTQKGETKRLWGLQTGKSSVFFARDSSISPMGCDTIYSAFPLARRSTFALPVALLCREIPLRQTEEALWSEGEARRTGERALRSWLAGELGEGGSIRMLRFTCAREGDVLYVTLHSECTERIDMELPHE